MGLFGHNPFGLAIFGSQDPEDGEEPAPPPAPVDDPSLWGIQATPNAGWGPMEWGRDGVGGAAFSMQPRAGGTVYSEPEEPNAFGLISREVCEGWGKQSFGVDPWAGALVDAGPRWPAFGWGADGWGTTPWSGATLSVDAVTAVRAAAQAFALGQGWGGIAFGAGPWSGAELDVTAPAPAPFALRIDNLIPGLGTPLGPTDPVYFDVVSGAALASVVVIAEYPHLGSEVIYNGSSFGERYRNEFSTVTALPQGRRYRMLRTGGWADASVKIRVVAFDVVGSTLVADYLWVVVAPASAGETIALIPVAARGRAKYDPLGTGPARPFRRTSQGDFAMLSGRELVAANVGQILGTVVGEVPWRPSFGTRVESARHRRNTAAAGELVRLSVEQAIGKWEPRVRILDVVLGDRGPNDNKLELAIRYTVPGATEPQTARVAV